MKAKEIIIAIIAIASSIIVAITFAYLIKKRKLRNLSSEFALEIDTFIFKISSKWKLNNREKNKLERKEREIKTKEKGENNEKLLLEYKKVIERYKNLLASEHDLTYQTIAKCKASSAVVKAMGRQKNRTDISRVSQLMKELDKISEESSASFVLLEKELKSKARKFLKEYKELLLRRIDEELSKERVMNKLPLKKSLL